jgi:23S rRNA (pseudouridine1915-N3)-methyltransferase
MKIRLLQIGKTQESYLLSGIQEYKKRINNYIQIEIETILNIKNSTSINNEVLKQKESELILQKLKKEDVLILLDEKGNKFDSVGFSQFMQRQMNSGNKQVVFLIGGAYGFSKEIYERADGKISISPMTFSHQLIRLIFLEQLYRAFTIIHHHPYHHE